MRIANILAAARADAIPKASSGLWFTLKIFCPVPMEAPRGLGLDGIRKMVTVPVGHYTQLWRLTVENMHLRIPGELVMCDMPDELDTHLDFMLHAHGDVLITGLGLGCVARGCRANPLVRSVTVIERDRDVLRLVAPYLPEGIKLVHADALRWADVLKSQPLVREFDCAWHDLWSDPDDDEAKHLQLMHSHLIALMAGRVRDFQGAWQLPRSFKKAVNRRRRSII